MIRHPAQLLLYLNSNRGLALYHIFIIKRGQEMRAFLGTKRLGCSKGCIKIITDKADLDLLTAKHPGLEDLLLWRSDRHKDHTPYPEVPTHKRNTLCMIASRGADKQRLFRDHLTHGVKGTAQFVGPDRG